MVYLSKRKSTTPFQLSQEVAFRLTRIEGVAICESRASEVYIEPIHFTPTGDETRDLSREAQGDKVFPPPFIHADGQRRSFRRRSSTLMVNGGAAGLVTALLAARDCFGQAYPGQLIAEAFEPKHSSEDGTALPQSQYPKCLVSGNFAGRAHSIGNPDGSSYS
jgi:hypothetical protein